MPPNASDSGLQMLSVEPFLTRTHIAYFSMEIAVRPEMPTYAGGLGVLAGDTARSCADLEQDIGVWRTRHSGKGRCDRSCFKSLRAAIGENSVGTIPRYGWQSAGLPPREERAPGSATRDR